MRAQRSIADISSARSTRQAAPPLPRGGGSDRKLNESRTRGHSSSSSSSSNNSSIFDGRKQSYDSSTSYDDDRDYKSTRKAPAARSRARERYAREEEEEEEEGPEAPPPPGAGSSIWNRMAAVAGALTVNVSKAWESSGTLNDGEATPAGQESRLTKFMKEYYIKNARSAKDLPSWLFDEKERRSQRDQEDDGRTSLPPRSKSRARGRDDPVSDEPLPAVPRRGGLRDIYEQASNSSSVPSSRTTGSSSLNDRGRDSNTGGGSSSKASSRLKALKDAKRGGSGSSARRGYDEDSPADSYEDVGGRDEPPAPSARTVRPGLPQGPGPRRR